MNNAGIAGVNKPTHEVTEEEWDYLMAVNVKGVFFCTKHAIPYMKTRGAGSIINLSSIYGIVGAADLPPYHASKGAVRLMSKNDALLYAADRIRANSIHPGFIWTPLVRALARQQGDVGEIRKSLDARHPIGHVGAGRYRLGRRLPCLRRSEVPHRQRTHDRRRVHGPVTKPGVTDGR